VADRSHITLTSAPINTHTPVKIHLASEPKLASFFLVLAGTDGHGDQTHLSEFHKPDSKFCGVAAWCSGNGVGRINEVTLCRARSVGYTWMGDRLRTGKPPSHPGQLSLLPPAGREMNTDQSAVMLCIGGIKISTARSTCVYLRDPSLTCANLSALETSIAHIIKHYTNVLFTFTLTSEVVGTSPTDEVS